MKRQLFIASSMASLGLAGCGPIKTAINESPLHKAVDAANALDYRIIGTHGMARLYTDADVDTDFRLDSLQTPSDSLYSSLAVDAFRGYTLAIAGAVERPSTFTLAELRAMQLQTQITRLDCVEGWSAIGKWRGVPLGALIAMVRPSAKARYLVFRCFDQDNQGTQYYGSIDLQQAAHPQTLLALDLNEKPIDPDHGGPVRLRIPTQLGYKNTKWIRRIDVVTTIAEIAGGNGGYWEDQGYAWYGGI